MVMVFICWNSLSHFILIPCVFLIILVLVGWATPFIGTVFRMHVIFIIGNSCSFADGLHILLTFYFLDEEFHSFFHLFIFFFFIELVFICGREGAR